MLDLLLYLGQLVTLVLTFVTGHTNSIPASDSFPYPDPLLPPEQSRYTAVKDADDDTEEADDVESGLKQRRRRGFESAFEELDTDEPSLWLNDDGDALPRSELLPDSQQNVAMDHSDRSSLIVKSPAS